MNQADNDKSRSNAITCGGILIVLGIVFLLGRLDIVDVGDIFSTFWPLILIGIGLKMIWDRKKAGEDGSRTDGEIISEDGPIQRSKTFGDLSLKVDSKAFEGGSISTTIGDLKIDLSKANIRSGEKTLRLNGVIGDIKVSVPKTLKVSVNANTTIGDLNIIDAKKDGFGVSQQYKSPGYEAAKKKLVISVSQGVGDISIKQVDPPKTTT